MLKDCIIKHRKGVCVHVYVYLCGNNFVQLSSNFCVKIAIQIMNWVV